MTKAPIEADGSFVDAYDDFEDVPVAAMTKGHTVVLSAPDNAAAKWSNGAWVAPAPSPDQLFAGMLKAGLQTISRETPTLNGTYSFDSTAQNEIAGIVTSLIAGTGLPGNQATAPWADIAGNPHNFTAADIVNLGKAMEEYIFALSQVRRTRRAGQPASDPTLPVTIP